MKHFNLNVDADLHQRFSTQCKTAGLTMTGTLLACMRDIASGRAAIYSGQIILPGASPAVQTPPPSIIEKQPVLSAAKEVEKLTEKGFKPVRFWMVAEQMNGPWNDDWMNINQCEQYADECAAKYGINPVDFVNVWKMFSFEMGVDEAWKQLQERVAAEAAAGKGKADDTR